MSTGDPTLTPSLTAVLQDWRGGDREALARLLPRVYDELRRQAEVYLGKERPGHTLQPTALVHEAYLKLSDKAHPRWRDRVHFFAVAAQLMRRILVDHARRHGAAKRGGGLLRVSLNEASSKLEDQALDLLALDQALERLSARDPRKGRIIELRFFGGLSLEETARVLEVSVPTVVNDTRLARAWLFREMSTEEDSSEAGPPGDA